MKKLFFLTFLLGTLATSYAQTSKNYIQGTLNGAEWTAEAKRMKIPVNRFRYLALAGFKVNPDESLWIRLYYFDDDLKPGTYPVVSAKGLEDAYRKNSKPTPFALVDYTSETQKLGHAFHDGESLSGTITITSVTDTFIEGTFEAKMTGTYYEKRALATLSGSGLRANLERKVLTSAGGGMLTTGDPHDHDNTRKSKETDSMEVVNGKFRVDWTPEENKK
ncbi:hypothetical protein GCM10027275_42390 [Rhabdobacter roseus]|uniref:Uncharacterized protein n=1 Tax=Rhabdobacter roseus TaxID=1655419 RepID=A0A840U1H1_9BACT|nr:hypothetical protein [Rhabdobacter roseus]MBB5286218.1 hypothetical protein [Rhabdobacter roseus]